MAIVTVNISEDGNYKKYQVHRGDTVLFKAAKHTVICFSNATIFGRHRFQVEAGTTLRVRVQATAKSEKADDGTFDCTTVTGNLKETCEQAAINPKAKTIGGEIIPPQ